MVKILTIYLAGVFTIFSPCILPMLPIIFKGVLASSKKNLIVMLSGLVFSYTILGWGFASFGGALSLNENHVRYFSSIVFIGLGLWMISTSLKVKMGHLLSRLTARANELSAQIETKKISGVFMLGALFGLVWTPCTGPALAFAITLASTSEGSVYSLFLMFIFGVGSVTPLFILSLGLNKFLLQRKRQEQLMKINTAFGYLVIILGGMMMIGLDRKVQSMLITISPDWLINLSILF